MPLAVFDLDGTIYPGSTLREYFIFGAKRLLQQRKLTGAFKIAAWAIASKLKLTSHLRAKFRVCTILHNHLSSSDLQQFAKRIADKVNPQVIQIVQQSRAKGMTPVLATASPAEYCQPLARLLGFDICLSTPLTSTLREYVENRGNRKLAAVKAVGHSVALVVTDHHDDLPLMLFNHGINLLVNPNPHTLTILRCSNVNFTLN